MPSPPAPAGASGSPVPAVPEPNPRPGALSSPAGSAEDEFWQIAGRLEARGVVRKRMGRIASKFDGNFVAALVAARAIEAAREPSSYAGRVIANLRAEEAAETAPIVSPRKGEPPFVIEARADGMPVRRNTDGTWEIGGETLNARGEVVGW